MMHWSKVAAKKIAADLDDRAGFSLAGVDAETKVKMIATWAKIITEALRDSKGGE